MNPKTISVNAKVPYDHAVCRVRNHLHRRCFIGRTAFGEGKFSYLHKMRDVRLQDVPQEHTMLERSLRQCGLAFMKIVGGELVSSILVNGPYPSYVDGETRFDGTGVNGSMDPNVSQERIFAASGIETDFVTYRLTGVFIGAEIPPEIQEEQCPGSGEQAILEASAAS